jgi:hypothetical protein
VKYRKIFVDVDEDEDEEPIRKIPAHPLLRPSGN